MTDQPPSRIPMPAINRASGPNNNINNAHPTSKKKHNMLILYKYVAARLPPTTKQTATVGYSKS
jgi:hypothetical protein